MTRDELERHLEGYLETLTFKDYCINGMQVEGKKSIEKMATAVSANLETIEEAVAQNVDALIVHHGLFWKNDSHKIEGSLRKKLKLLLENEISLFGYHLPLDAHPEIGNNWRAAKEMGWSALKPFGNYLEREIGVRGAVAPIEIDDFIAQVETYYRHPAMVSKGRGEKVHSVALVSGGAWKEVKEAAKAGVDCFITGNFDEPAWSIAREENIHFMALGHHATERIGPKALAHYLEKQFNIPCPFLDIDNPF